MDAWADYTTNGAFTYDPAHPHSIKTHTDGRAQVSTYTYDPLDRATTIAYSDGTSVVYGYDEEGVTRFPMKGLPPEQEPAPPQPEAAPARPETVAVQQAPPPAPAPVAGL